MPPLVSWKRLEIVRSVRNWTGIPASRKLTHDQLEAIKSVINREARPTPIRTPFSASHGDVATVEYPLRLTAYQMSVGSPEAIIGILGEANGTNRLVYGVMTDKGYEIHWDSPLFYAWMLKVGFEDVDSDGTKEILVEARMA